MQRSLLICPVPGSFPPDRLFRMCVPGIHLLVFFIIGAEESVSATLQNSDIIFEAPFFNLRQTRLYIAAAKGILAENINPVKISEMS